MPRKPDAQLWNIEWGKETDSGCMIDIEDVIIVAGPKQESAIAKWRAFLKKKGRKMPTKFTIESMGTIDIF